MVWEPLAMFFQPSRAVRRSVLIADDDPEARRQLRNLLAANGYAVIEAGNGRIARTLLSEQAPDVVVSDIFMPECDGFELIAAIRAMDRPIPVIAMSDHESWTGLNFLDAANDLGAAAVLEKPFRAHTLLRLLGDVLAVSQREARVVAFGRFAERQSGCIPAGLEWLGGRTTTRI
jgi:DNA-binding NtrC family response regulator